MIEDSSPRQLVNGNCKNCKKNCREACGEKLVKDMIEGGSYKSYHLPLPKTDLPHEDSVLTEAPNLETTTDTGTFAAPNGFFFPALAAADARDGTHVCRDAIVAISPVTDEIVKASLSFLLSFFLFSKQKLDSSVTQDKQSRYLVLGQEAGV
jgi:hypothetical protein